MCKDNQKTLPCLGRIMGQIPGLSLPDFAKKKAAGARRRLGIASGTAYRIIILEKNCGIKKIVVGCY